MCPFIGTDAVEYGNYVTKLNIRLCHTKNPVVVSHIVITKTSVKQVNRSQKLRWCIGYLSDLVDGLNRNLSSV